MKINGKLLLLIFRCVALGLSLGVVCLIGMEKIETKNALMLLALSVVALAATSLGEHSKE